jgi:hypothetical protein
MAAVKKNMPFLKLLAQSDSRQYDALLKTSNANQQEILRQITRNVLEGQLVLGKSLIQKFKRFEKGLISFADSKKPTIKKKCCLKLKRLWPALLKAVLPQLELLE